MSQPKVFISYSHKDEAEKEALLSHLGVLQQGGLIELWSDDRIIAGVDWKQEIRTELAQAHVVILLITANFLNSDFIRGREIVPVLERREREGLIVLPVIAKACAWKTVSWLSGMAVRPRNGRPVWSDAGVHQDEDLMTIAEEVAQIVDKSKIAAPSQSHHIFISYKRNAEPDESLVKPIYQALIDGGHRVFIDQNMKIGVEWAGEIQRQIEASDFMLVFLSEASIQSEMVAKEVEHAHRHYQKTGKARLLPIRVNFTDALPYQLSHYLDKIQYAEWHSHADTERLIKQLLEAINDIQSLPLPSQASSPPGYESAFIGPNPYADPRFIESLREPSGAVRLRSEFYIKRETDELLSRELTKPFGTTTTIRAPRQTGKSSLLIRGVAQAQNNGSRIALIDLQPIEDIYLESLDSFLRYFAELVVTKLRLDPAEVEKGWRSSLGASDKMTYLMEGYILPEIGANIVLAIDEADRLLRTNFHDTFFGLLRYWHNNRAMNELWERLDIIMAISTEPHLLISDVTQSPFNVGLKIRLQDFNELQVRELNQRHRSPLREDEVGPFMSFLNGHPYLTRKALYTMVTSGMGWLRLMKVAVTDQSPFGDHLRRYLWLISQQPELRNALKQIILRGKCPDEVSFYRLLRSGLIKGEDSKSCTCRCKLYEVYLKDRL